VRVAMEMYVNGKSGRGRPKEMKDKQNRE